MSFKSLSHSCRWLFAALKVTIMHSQPCYYLMSSQLQHSSTWVYLSDRGYSNNVKCKIDFPQMFTKNVEYNTVCVYSSGVKCLNFNKNNPGFFKCSVKSNWLSTLNIYLLIKSDVSGFLASLILINLAFSSKCLSLKLMRAHMENIFRLQKWAQPWLTLIIPLL